MAAASLDVNSKEELSVIEQCEYLILLIPPCCFLFPPILIISSFPRVQGYFRSGAHGRFYNNILLKDRSASSPSCNKWPGPNP